MRQFTSPKYGNLKKNIKFTVRQFASTCLSVKTPQTTQSKQGCKDQESIQSSTTPDPGYQWESDKLTVDTTNESQEVSPFPAGDHKAHITLNKCTKTSLSSFKQPHVPKHTTPNTSTPNMGQHTTLWYLSHIRKSFEALWSPAGKGLTSWLSWCLL